MQSISASSDTSASKFWSTIRESIYQNALESFGKKKKFNKDWFGENINVLLPLIKVKRQAYVEYQLDPNSKSLNRLHEAKKGFLKNYDEIGERVLVEN